ncbi:Uncharacterized protein ACO02O_05860 [Dirofilaria immitis]
MKRLSTSYSYISKLSCHDTMQRYFSQTHLTGHINKMKEGWTASSMYKINGEIPLVIYMSNYSKLRVAIASTPGPLVKGLISFVTETLDNDGLPHTLEHLVFMGSQKYPYKGVLDLIANRCMASGTNAFTAQDHTGYELITVGSQGFLKVLPIYLDHLLSPTLTDAQFMTEVHHINSKGEDAGVVYSEMQEYESEMSSIVSWKRKELFYPPNNPYRVETGGRLAALRTTCNMEKIRRYHRDFYHIDNMLLTVCGSIDHSKLLHILSSIEEASQQRVPHLFSSPFKNSMLLFTEPQDKEIVCPSEDEKLGVVEIAWKGPSKNLEELQQLEVLTYYLADTVASPLEQDFVQLDEQFASSVHLDIYEQYISEIVLCFNGVPINKLQNIKTRLFEKTLPETFEKNFDGERMKNTISNMIDKELSKMETDCHDFVFELLCMHQIYGNDDLEMRLDHVTQLQKMLAMQPDDWIRLARRYLTNECICVMGCPSRDEVTRIATTEKNRVEEQRRKLGEDGLRQHAEKLEKAIHETTAQKPPPELLSKMMVCELENFATFNVQTLHARTDQNDNEIFNLPLPVYIHNVKTHFVELILIWDTKLIPFELRIWLMLYFKLMFQSPAFVDDRKLSYEEMAKLYTRDLISYSAASGVLNYFERFCSLALKTVPERYDIMLSWLTTFVKGIIFEAERIKVAVQSLIAEADEEKRDGSEMQNVLLYTALFHEESNEYMYGLVQLEEFHKNVLRLTNDNPIYVIDKLERLRDALINSPTNVHIICDTEKIMPSLPTNLAWLYHDRKSTCKPFTDFRNSPGEAVTYNNFGKQRVVAVGATESSFLKQSIPFKYRMGSEEGLAVQLIAQYLSQVEGTLYKAIRGNGLAYGVNIEINPDDQLLSFSIHQSAQLEQAYEEAKKVVFNELKHVDEIEFEAAKRSLVSMIVQSEDTVINAAHQAVFNEFRELPFQFWRKYSERIWNASMKEVVECSRNFMLDLFDDRKCYRAITVPHGKLRDIEKYFTGIEVVRSSDLHVKATSVFR